MEDSQFSGQVVSFFEVEQVDFGYFLDNKDQEEVLFLDWSSIIVLDYVVDMQDFIEFLDEVFLLGEFVVFFFYWFFFEFFDYCKLGEQYSCYGDGGKQELDLQWFQIICNYMEIYFLDMQEEEVWLQQCVQCINDEFEGFGLDVGSEGDVLCDDCYDFFSLFDDILVVKVEDSFEGEWLGCCFKKIWLVFIDFDKLEIFQFDFEVFGVDCLFSKEQLCSIYESSLFIGNFVLCLLVYLFFEFFMYENLCKQYNCSGFLGKKQLDLFCIKFICYYVQLFYLCVKNDCVWILEFVGKLDECCWCWDMEQRCFYQQQCKVYVLGFECRDLISYVINFERFWEEFEGFFFFF